MTPATGFASVQGTVDIQSDPTRFLSAFANRIETGLLQSTAERRNNYVVTRRDGQALAFRAANWWTAFNVGLNDVTLAVSSDGRVRYGISYGRWMGYGLVLCAAFGIGFIIFLLTYDIRAYLVEHPSSQLPGLSLDQNIAIAWAMALFWGFTWPWILTALHKRPLRRLMSRLIAEVDRATIAPAHDHVAR